jgi:hypothetical protein
MQGKFLFSMKLTFIVYFMAPNNRKPQSQIFLRLCCDAGHFFPEWKLKQRNSWNDFCSIRAPMHVSTRYKSIFAGRATPLACCANVGRRCGGASAAFSHGKHGKLEKGGGERGERSARGAHVMAMRPFSASAAGPRLPAIDQPLAVTALHAHHEHFQRAHSARAPQTQI